MTPEEQIEIMNNVFAPYYSEVWTDEVMCAMAESREQELNKNLNKKGSKDAKCR